MRFKIDWASLIVGSKFAVFALFYFVFKGNFPYYKPRGGAYIWRGNVTDVFCVSGLGGIYLEGLKRRGLFSEFYGVRFKISSFSCGPADTAIHACKTS